MPGSWEPSELPRLTQDNHAITSCYDTRYNCIAWAASDILRWWEPASGTHHGRPNYWPADVPKEWNVAAYAAAFATLGYVDSGNGFLEPGWEKVALFAVESGGNFSVEHAARQLPDGTWTSKLGDCEDITHMSVTDVCCPDYGSVVRFLKRRLGGTGPPSCKTPSRPAGSNLSTANGSTSLAASHFPEADAIPALLRGDHTVAAQSKMARH